MKYREVKLKFTKREQGGKDMDRKFFVTTPIYYVNDRPHIGHLYTTSIADIIARAKRKQGYDVLFSTGTDEHAVKIKRVADEKGIPVKDYVDNLSDFWKKTFNDFNISFDTFIRTSEERHKKVVTHFFKTLMDKGDIYKGIYEGWYCIYDETFFSEDELLPGNLCPVCKRPVEKVKEENYFFALSKYEDKLLDYYLSHPDFVEPKSRYNEMLSLIKSGLKDVSISRKGIGWGIPVPGDPNAVIYVWFDALINYVTVSGYLQNEEKFNKYWPADLHLIGKDITRFHSVIWPAMLMGMGLPLPKKIFAHGFWLAEGEKMSKSKGNFIKPNEVIEWFMKKTNIDRNLAIDVFRYYILRDMTFGEDGNFSYSSFITRYNTELANDLGNLLNRTTNLAVKFFDGSLGEGYDRGYYVIFEKAFDEIVSLYNDLKLSEVPVKINALANTLNKYLDSKAPWRLIKEGDKEEAEIVLSTVLHGLEIVLHLISPIMPESVKLFFKSLGKKEEEGTLIKEKLFPWKGGYKIEKIPPIFPRVEEKVKVKEEKKMAEEEYITIEDFKKLDLRVAEIVSAEKIEGADKLLKLTINIGDETRTLVAGIAQYYKPEEIIGKKIIVIKNLKPRKLRGVVSQGMLLAATTESTVSILTPDKDVPNGTKIT